MKNLRAEAETRKEITADSTNRSDVFKVKVSGRLELPEDDLAYGSYFKNKSLQLNEANSITEAVNLVASAHDNNDWKFRDPNRDYFDSELGRDMGPLSFEPNIVEIFDQENVKVLSGHFKSGLKWESPATERETRDINKKVSALRQEALVQGGWDNHATSRRLDAEADRLETRVTSSKYRNNPEVLTVIENQKKQQLENNPEEAYKECVERAYQSKEEQSKRIEEQIRKEIKSHQAVIEKLETQRPGLLTSSSKKKAWGQALHNEKKQAERKQKRLERVENLHHGMGLSSSKLTEMAVVKARYLDPDVANARDQRLQRKRQHEKQEKKVMQEGEKKTRNCRL
ncbi:hypothetical protein ACLEDP_16615 [Lonsdalea quercina]|uniref:hypothetical protein n=1 Tax=Lonsdalea quercina TaxID=71657 RepID=UPI0039760424